jgi:hypothetical protein
VESSALSVPWRSGATGFASVLDSGYTNTGAARALAEPVAHGNWFDHEP